MSGSAEAADAQSACAEAAARIILLENALHTRLNETVGARIDVKRVLLNGDRDLLQEAELLLIQHGATEAWRVLIVRAIEQHLAGMSEDREVTERILDALEVLTKVE